jgi:hypothetical protein
MCRSRCLCRSALRNEIRRARAALMAAQVPFANPKLGNAFSFGWGAESSQP